MLLQLIFDQESAESSGAYRINEIRDELNRDYTFLVDHDRCYFSMTEIKNDIAAKLEVDVSEIELEEV